MTTRRQKAFEDQTVDAIIADLSGRGGIGSEWEAIDRPIQREIRERWAEIVRSNFAAARNELRELLEEAAKEADEARGRDARELPAGPSRSEAVASATGRALGLRAAAELLKRALGE